MKKKSHYPSYHVMDQKDHWDDHTQKVVGSRLTSQLEHRFLTTLEAETLKRIAGDLVNEDREEIIKYIVDYMDQTLSSEWGEGQRKVGVPKAQVLVREGLKAIDKSAEKQYGLQLLALDSPSRLHLLEQLSENQVAPVEDWQPLSQVEVFKKLLSMSIEAYYSHPTIWSEMGYGGPAYPRGYIRTQLGQLDPWEAQPE